MPTEQTEQIRRFVVSVGRFDGAVTQVQVTETETVGRALSKADISLSGSEQINTDDGESVNVNDLVTEGQSYWVVGNYKNA